MFLCVFVDKRESEGGGLQEAMSIIFLHIQCGLTCLYTVASLTAAQEHMQWYKLSGKLSPKAAIYTIVCLSVRLYKHSRLMIVVARLVNTET